MTAAAITMKSSTMSTQATIAKNQFGKNCSIEGQGAKV
jgi:hypothetical protein